jgi:hypothetical protein
MKWQQDAVMAKAQFGTQRRKGDLEPSIPTPTDIDEQSLEKLNATWKKSGISSCISNFLQTGQSWID